MHRSNSRWSRLATSAALIAAGFTVLVPLPALSQAGVVDIDTVRAGRFDSGKMWTFEYSPAEYFSEEYGFDANEEWFERARMSALRIPGCSASFVSPNGLVATNHHCVRSRVSNVSRPGEDLLDNGFYATTLDEERSLPGMFADQLIAVRDITDEVAAAGAEGNETREALASIAENLRAQYLDRGDSIFVQTIGLYNGGRYSAYVFRRYTDVRLVAAAELQIGFFGGDPDNFTYPRYALDFAFLRVYGQDGRPFQTDHYFGWGSGGVEEGDAVFVIGSPGPTQRLTTMSQLEYKRDVQQPNTVTWLTTRLDALYDFWERDPEAAREFQIRNRIFGLSNSLKANSGMYEALANPVVMAKRQDAENQLRQAIDQDPQLAERFGLLFDRMAEVQGRRAELADADAAFRVLTSSVYSSATVRRAIAVNVLLDATENDVGEDSLTLLRRAVSDIADLPRALELRYLAARLNDFERSFGAEHEINRVTGDGPALDRAAGILRISGLATADRAARSLGRLNRLTSDPAVRLAAAFLPHYRQFRQRAGELGAEERALAADLGRVKFAVYGTSVAPDATRSPRITDGVVRGFEYNGTVAPPYTTFYGLYDRHRSHGGAADWVLPDRWATPPAGLDLGTPLNFVSTADTYGGNSGSPAVTKDLELVGLNFDRNIQGLSRAYIYLPESGRNIMVDVRAVQAAMDHVYDADRIVQELLTGNLFETEAEADASID